MADQRAAVKRIGSTGLEFEGARQAFRRLLDSRDNLTLQAVLVWKNRRKILTDLFERFNLPERSQGTSTSCQ